MGRGLGHDDIVRLLTSTRKRLLTPSSATSHSARELTRRLPQRRADVPLQCEEKAPNAVRGLFLPLSERGARLLELAELGGAWLLWNNLPARPFSIAEKRDMKCLEVARFASALSLPSWCSTPQSCRRKRRLMMRQGPFPLAAMTLLEIKVSRSPLTRGCVSASSRAFTISAETCAFRLQPVSPRLRISSQDMQTVEKEARKTTSAKLRWKRCDLLGLAEKDMTYKSKLARKRPVQSPFPTLTLCQLTRRRSHGESWMKPNRISMRSLADGDLW